MYSNFSKAPEKESGGTPNQTEELPEILNKTW
jgi:hypothetical protein